MYDYEEQNARIVKILGGSEVPQVTVENLSTYISYLNKNMDIPCDLTGSEDFPWEEYYVFGPGCQIEYEEKKKTQPSSEDVYTFLSFQEDEVNDFYGIMVNVRRKKDSRKFTLPLDYLKSTDADSKNFQLLQDYSVWFVNNRE